MASEAVDGWNKAEQECLLVSLTRNNNSKVK